MQVTMRAVVQTYVLLLCASGCGFLDELDRSIEQKAEQLTSEVAKPAATPQPTPQPTPPSAIPEPPIAPVVPAAELEPPESPRGAPKITLGTIDVRGALTVKDVRKIIERHSNELRFCYEQTLAGNAKVAIKFIVSPAGAVQIASIERSDSGIEKLDMCLAHAVRRWSFPAPKGGGIAVVIAEVALSRR
jgi:TonB family protein